MISTGMTSGLKNILGRKRRICIMLPKQESHLPEFESEGNLEDIWSLFTAGTAPSVLTPTGDSQPLVGHAHCQGAQLFERSLL